MSLDHDDSREALVSWWLLLADVRNGSGGRKRNKREKITDKKLEKSNFFWLTLNPNFFVLRHKIHRLVKKRQSYLHCCSDYKEEKASLDVRIAQDQQVRPIHNANLLSPR